ncbi:MAG TPA: M20 family metallopeptidase [Lacisediminihabitans sp.]|uniref:M20 family metallopeptidase n=1 Tax=Lacisediminihabitans sp. TaxID=2787631 RepID=UPI002ED80959
MTRLPGGREAVSAAIEALRGRAATISREIHAHPELPFREERASALLSSWLEDEGFTVESGVADMPTAFVGRWGSGSPRIAVMAEYDALPGLGHGCGHNLIAAGGVLAAAALRRAMAGSGAAGTLEVIGTPAEEGGGGKILELNAGVFDGIDGALMFHPADRTILDRRMLACVHLRITFRGVAAHAAKNPDLGKNALAAMVLFFTGVDALRQHVNDGARMHGIITDGGSAVNVVPDRSEADFMVRHLTLAEVAVLRDRVTAVARGAALMTGTEVTVEETAPPYAHLESNGPMVDRLDLIMKELGLSVEEAAPDDRTGSTDAGNVSLALPTVHPFMQVAPRGTPSHSVAFREAAESDEAQDAMVDMATALALLGWDLFDDSELLASASSHWRSAAARRHADQTTSEERKAF